MEVAAEVAESDDLTVLMDDMLAVLLFWLFLSFRLLVLAGEDADVECRLSLEGSDVEDMPGCRAELGVCVE